jgi:hypothetical protein
MVRSKTGRRPHDRFARPPRQPLVLPGDHPDPHSPLARKALKRPSDRLRRCPAVATLRQPRADLHIPVGGGETNRKPTRPKAFRRQPARRLTRRQVNPMIVIDGIDRHLIHHDFSMASASSAKKQTSARRPRSEPTCCKHVSSGVHAERISVAAAQPARAVMPVDARNRVACAETSARRARPRTLSRPTGAPAGLPDDHYAIRHPGEHCRAA